MSGTGTNTAFDKEDEEQQQQRLNHVQRGGNAPDYTTLSDAKQATRMQNYAKRVKTNADATSLGIGQTGTMADNVSMYKSVTNMLAQLNESMNANDYILRTLSTELKRVTDLNNEARKDVYKSQQRFLTESYNLHYTEFIIRIVIFTAVATGLLASTVAGWFQGAYPAYVFFVILAVFALLYASVMAALFANNANRRQVHWNQFYWGSMGEEKEKDDGEDINSDDGDCS
jgi:hypothetical protein